MNEINSFLHTERAWKLPQHELSSLSVTPKSHWQDDAWILHDLPAGTRKTIHWTYELETPTGEKVRLTDPGYEQWVHSSKLYIWSLQNDPSPDRSSISDNTLYSKCCNLRVLTKWMIAQSYNSYEDIDELVAERFMQFLRNTGRSNRAEDYYETFISLYSQRDKMASPLMKHPFPSQNMSHYLAPTSRRDEGRTVVTPDSVAIPMLRAAIELTQVNADSIIETYHAEILSYIPYRDTPFMFAWGDRPVRISDAVRRLTDACYLLISYFCGPRHTEIAGLRVGCVKNAVHRSADGIDEFSYITGSVSKTNLASHDWLAPPVVLRAIEVMERLYAPIRDHVGNDTLFIVPTLNSIFKLDQRWDDLTSSAVSRRINSGFIPCFSVPNYNGKPWSYATHQGRKTFGTFAGRRDTSSLGALQQQYGHFSRAMTQSYAGTDSELVQSVQQYIAEDTEATLRYLLSQSNLVGPMGEQMMKSSLFAGQISQETRDQLVSEYASNGHVRLGTCEYGVCTYRKHHAACQGDDSGPDHSIRSFSVCMRCNNFVTANKWRYFFENAITDNDELLAQPNLDEASRQECLRQKNDAQTILKQLDEPKRKEYRDE